MKENNRHSGNYQNDGITKMADRKADIKWHDMPETEYRSTRIFRVLGNPKTYAIVKLLYKIKKASPSELARQLNRSVKTVSDHLRTLREIDIVEYQKQGKSTVYRLKYDRIVKILQQMEALIEEIRTTE